MDDSKEKLQENFQTLKTELSGYYRGERYKWLRCCLYGIVPGAELDKTRVGAHLFNVLDIHGKILPKNVKLLSEITELTGITDAIDCVNKYKHENNIQDAGGNMLTPYRRSLVKALMSAEKQEFQNVIANYQELSHYVFNDLWDAVLKLERVRLLEDNPMKIERFINLLEEDTKARFLAEQYSSSGKLISKTPVNQQGSKEFDYQGGTWTLKDIRLSKPENAISIKQAVKGRSRDGTRPVHMKVADNWYGCIRNTYEIYVETWSGTRYWPKDMNRYYTFALTSKCDAIICVEDTDDGWTVEPNELCVDKSLLWERFACTFYLKSATVVTNQPTCKIWVKQNGRKHTPCIQIPHTSREHQEEVIPLEIRAHGPEAQKIFTEAQKNGVVEVAQGRVIFMGLERVGKTSTIKTFLKEKFNPKEKSTDALATNRTCIQESDNWSEVGDDKSPVAVIHEKKNSNSDPVKDSALTKGPNPAGTSTTTNVAPEIVEEVVKKMRFTNEATSEWKESTDEFIMNIWDFGGQPIYHVIQRAYIPSFAVVCVVFNLEHDLDSHAVVMDHTNGKSYEHRMTYLDFILFWIRTACTNRIASKDQDQSVLLIGTHCNSLKLGKNEEERKSQIERKLNKILESLKDKPYEEMVFLKIFTIENSVPFNESNASEIMKQILTFTKKKVQKLPFNWLYVQNEIQKLKKEHICQETSKIIDLLERCQIPQREQKVLLQYLHDTGEIFYYPDDKDLRNYIVLDLIRIVVLSRAIITIKNPELQESMVQAWRNLDNGILERRLLEHLWSKLGVENEKCDFFASLLEYFGLMCKGKDQESGFYVLSRLKPERKNIPDKNYGNRAISIFHDFSNYLPDSFFQWGATKFITRFQMKYKKPTLSYELVELNIDEKHLVILNVDTINHRRMFKTTIVRSKHRDSPDEEPEASVCKKVLQFLNVEFSKEQGLEMMVCIPGECCENHQLLPVESFDTRQISCGDKATNITRYKELFGNCALKTLRHNELSKENFNDLLYDVASTWKDKGDVNRLKVILCEFKRLAITAIENKNDPYDLLQLLIGPGIISQSDVKVLIEAAELGDIQSVESKIKEKVPSFAGFNKHVIHKFSAHRQNLMNFGKKLGCEAIQKIAQLYEIDKPADEWMLIFKLERKGELTEKTKEKFIERLTGKGMGVQANELNMF